MQARPQDILLAYNPDFTGLTSLNQMATTLEPSGDLAVAPGAPETGGSTGVLGGTADADGYYEDFTARLDRFVRAYPRLGGTGPAFGAPGRLDWNAIVVAFDESEGSSGDESAGPGGDESAGPGDDESAGILASERHLADARSATGGSPALVSLSNFIVEVDGGKTARHALIRADSLGEMDETEAETLISGSEQGSKQASRRPSLVEGPESSSILDFATDK